MVKLCWFALGLTILAEQLRQRDWTISLLAGNGCRLLMSLGDLGGNQGKQNFCCEKHGIACKAALTTPAFNCNEDYHSWFLTCIASMGLVVCLGLVNLAPDITPHQWPKQDQTPSQTPKETKDSFFLQANDQTANDHQSQTCRRWHIRSHANRFWDS